MLVFCVLISLCVGVQFYLIKMLFDKCAGNKKAMISQIKGNADLQYSQVKQIRGIIDSIDWEKMVANNIPSDVVRKAKPRANVKAGARERARQLNKNN